MKKAIYPGSFDPITNGHLDVLRKSLKVFDEVTILIADNPNKKSNFTLEEKKIMIKEAVKEYKNVHVDAIHGISVEYAKRNGAVALIRGLRNSIDFEYELQLSEINQFIDNDIETVFFMASNDIRSISSSSINEMHSQGIDISKLVPPSVVKMYKTKD